MKLLFENEIKVIRRRYTYTNDEKAITPWYLKDCQWDETVVEYGGQELFYRKMPIQPEQKQNDPVDKFWEHIIQFAPNIEKQEPTLTDQYNERVQYIHNLFHKKRRNLFQRLYDHFKPLYCGIYRFVAKRLCHRHTLYRFKES